MDSPFKKEVLTVNSLRHPPPGDFFRKMNVLSPDEAKKRGRYLTVLKKSFRSGKIICYPGRGQKPGSDV